MKLFYPERRLKREMKIRELSAKMLLLAQRLPSGRLTKFL
jgi:hypothetical protein